MCYGVLIYLIIKGITTLLEAQKKVKLDFIKNLISLTPCPLPKTKTSYLRKNFAKLSHR